MTILGFCGFETGVLDPANDGTRSGANVNVSNTHVRTGNWALRIHPSAQSAQYCSVSGTSSGFYAAGYFYIATLPSADSIIFNFGNGANTLSVRCDNSGVLTLVGTTTSTSFGTVSTGQWYRVDVHAVQNGTSSASLDFGTAQTCSTANSSVLQFYAGNRSATAYTYDIYYDDMVTASVDLTGTHYQVNMLLPTGAGTDATGFTSGTGSTFAEVDEGAPTADTIGDGDTTYIKALAVNDVRGYTLQSAAAAGCLGAIDAVCGYIGTRKVGTPSVTSSIRIRITGSTRNVTAVALTTSYVAQGQSNNLDTAPDNAAWTVAKLDTIEIACNISTLGAGGEARCTVMGALVLSHEPPPVLNIASNLVKAAAALNVAQPYSEQITTTIENILAALAAKQDFDLHLTTTIKKVTSSINISQASEDNEVWIPTWSDAWVDTWQETWG